MASLNACTFIGNIGKIETKVMTSGESVVNFSLACNENWKDKSGEKQEKTEWINCVAYRKLAEIMRDYVQVGSQSYVSGKMQTRKYTDKAGIEKYSTEIIVNEMVMLGGKSDSKPEEARAPRPPAAVPAAGFDDMDNIPFAPHGKAGAGVSWRAM